MRHANLLLSIMLLISITARAEKEFEQRFLYGCKQVGHEFENGKLVFKPVFITVENQGMFFLHNLTDNQITIKYQQTSSTTVYPSWETTVDASRWGAFATDKNNLAFTCFTETATEVDCKQVLEVCQYTRAEFGRQNQGNYWVSVNLSKIETRDDVIQKGILLRW